MEQAKTFGDVFKNLAIISFRRFTIKDQTFFVKRLSFLVRAGVPVLESLIMIREQTHAKSYGHVLDKVIENVTNGQKLSTSLSKHRGMFGDFSINIIGFGEASGMLVENLEYLAEELRKRHQLRKKIIGAFIYPLIVIIATFGITGFLMIYLFPKIMPIFASLHIELPFSTRAVIFLSNFIRTSGIYALIALIIFAIIMTILHKKNRIFRFYWDTYLLKLPLIGKVIKNFNIANSTRTIGLLLKGGVTLSEAVPIAERTTANMAYQKEFRNISECINRGDSLALHLSSRKDLFPDTFSQIVSVGERSGNLSNSLVYLSELYESEVDDFTKNIGTVIEPILMVIMGVLVGFIAISIITPIYSITQNLHG